MSLPAHVDPVAACFLDSIACAIRAVRLGGLSNHDTVLVGGGGFLGIIVALLAQHRGAKVVMVADSELSNRALAAVDLGRTSNNDPRLETLSPTVLVDVSGRKSLFEKFLRTAARPARIVIMTRAGESLCRHFNERADTLAVDFIRSFHSTVDDRQRATEALPVLAPAIRRLSVEYALEHAQKALTAVALKSHVRCHLTLAPKDAQLSLGPKPSMVQSIR